MLNRLKGLIVLLSLVSGSAVSQDIKETAVGKLGMKLVAALNSNDRETQLNFINSFLDSRALENGADSWIKKFGELYSLTGGVEIIAMQTGRTPDEVRMQVKSLRGNPVFDLATRISPESPEKLIGFIFRPLQASSALPWPQNPLSESSIVAEIEKHIQADVDDDHFSGAVLIAKGDRILVNKAYGLANKDKKIPNQTDTKFNIGSMNKMFTSVAIAQLVQAGKLSYQDTLAKILPTYPNKAVATKITIHHLLTHTSGLDNFFKPEFFEHREKYVNLISYLPLFANDPLLFEPGKDWAYSNAGFIVLGIVVEKISGENYFDYVRNHIFKPAQMIHTDSYERDAVIPNLAAGYTYDENDPQHKMSRHDNKATLPIKGSSAGGGYSTTGDIFLFSKALLGHNLLNEELTNTITSGKVDDHRLNSKYAYGFSDQTFSGKHIVGHNGGGPGINGSLKILKDNGYTVIVLSNYSPPSADGLASEMSEFLIRQ
jgi:CubicO group peptidase (beta-lactamase class C family)